MRIYFLMLIELTYLKTPAPKTTYATVYKLRLALINSRYPQHNLHYNLLHSITF